MAGNIINNLTELHYNDDGTCELYLAQTGECVYRGKHGRHVFSMRDDTENALEAGKQIPPRKGPKSCMNCWRYIMTTTLGSMDAPVWHCRHGFAPSADCQNMAEYNENIVRKEPPRQLELF